MQSIKADILAETIPGGIDLNNDHQVNVCGSKCPDSNAIACILRSSGVSVVEDGCHGTRGGCSTNGALIEGTYASVPVQTDTGLHRTEVTIIV